MRNSYLPHPFPESLIYGVIENTAYSIQYSEVNLVFRIKFSIIDTFKKIYNQLFIDHKIGSDFRRISVQVFDYHSKAPGSLSGAMPKNRAYGSKYSRTYGSAEVFLRFL